MVVGLGGILVEVMQDAATRVLPVGESEVRSMLATLRGFPLLSGVRGRPGVDIDDLVRAVSRIADAGSDIDVVSLEVNPLLARPDGAIGLDALVVTAVSTREGAKA